MKSKILAICCIFAWCILLAFGFQVSSSQARNQEPNSLAQFQLAQAQPIDVLNQQLNSIREKAPQTIAELYQRLKKIKKENSNLLFQLTLIELKKLREAKPELTLELLRSEQILAAAPRLTDKFYQKLEEFEAVSQVAICPGSTRPTQITTDLAQQPPDACAKDSQALFDIFSWNSFIALNWSANPQTCEPDTSKLITDKNPGPVVWETFSQDTDVFVAPGTKPAEWCTPQQNEPKKFSFRKASPTFLQRLSLSSPMIASDIAEAVGGVLTDQNGRFVRYEKRLNHDEYQYIVTNNLWNKQGQQGQTIDFPSGSNSSGQTGAIEIKAAWKVLTPEEIKKGSFYTTEAIVDNDEKGDPSPDPNPVTLGLVGLHIIHKTSTQPNWIWSTFEHVDNAPTIDTGEMKKPHSFYNQDCFGQYCEQNKQTATKPYKELKQDGTPINSPVQVVRTTPLQASKELNQYYQNLLEGSVWANYELVSTQWTGGFPAGAKPSVLANTTMETFIQPQSSCIGCHKGGQDFSFLLGEAK